MKLVLMDITNCSGCFRSPSSVNPLISIDKTGILEVSSAITLLFLKTSSFPVFLWQNLKRIRPVGSFDNYLFSFSLTFLIYKLTQNQNSKLHKKHFWPCRFNIESYFQNASSKIVLIYKYIPFCIEINLA